MGQAQINVRTRACSRTSIARTKQAALTHNVRGKELKRPLNLFMAENNSESVDVDPPPPLQHRHTWNGYLLTGSCG